MIIIVLALLGLAAGSFVNALVWRVYKQAQQPKHGKPRSKKNKRVLHNYSIWSGRSMCTECHHILAWYDLIPVFSWVQLRGKCRYCNKTISSAYPIVEILTAALMVVSFEFWPYELNNAASWLMFGFWLILLVLGVALAKYDLKWMILPSGLVYAFTGISGLFLFASYFSTNNVDILLAGIVGALCYSGFFYLLYQVSKGKWIGGGDVRLAVGLGLLLGWQKSILGLTLAAYLGTFLIFVLIVLKKYHKRMKLPFGPFLLFAAYLTLLFGQTVIDWYISLAQL